MKLSSLLIAAVAICSACCPKCEKKHSDEASKLLSQLQSNVNSGIIMYGHQDDLMYGHSWRIDSTDNEYFNSDVKSVTGSYPAVLGMDLGGLELGWSRNLDKNSFAQMREAALKHYERGGVVTFSWHAYNPLTGGDSWDVSSNEVVASILDGGAKHELFMSWLERVANYLSEFKNAEGELIPLIFRPWHEHTGSWFWWGQKLCSKEQYQQLWRLTYDYLVKTRGLNNLIWAYSPSSTGLSDGLYLERWPGDDIVDMVGIDLYQYSTAEAYISSTQAALDTVSRVAIEHGKIAAYTETGYESIPAENWWTDVLYNTIKDYPIAYVLTWRNAWDMPQHFYAPWPGQASEDNFKEFTEKENIKVL